MIKPFSEMTQEMVFLISTFKLWVVLDVAFGHHLFFGWWMWDRLQPLRVFRLGCEPKDQSHNRPVDSKR